MGERETSREFGRILNELGIIGGQRLSFEDAIRPTGRILELRHFGEPIGAVLCTKHHIGTATVALRNHFWIDRGTARKVIPLAVSFTGATNMHIVPPGTGLDADVASASVVPETFLGTDYTPLSRLAYLNSTVNPTTNALGFIFTFGVSGILQPLNSFHALSFAHTARGGAGGGSGRFHMIADTPNIAVTCSMAWLEVL